MKFIDGFLNKFTMYKLTLYFLVILMFYALILSFFGFLSYKPLDIVLSMSVSVFFCYFSNVIFAKLFKATTNIESVFITSLILTLIISPTLSTNAPFIIAAAIVSMGAKYLPTIEKRHIFNPAAASVATISMLFPEHAATWWIGTPMMVLPVFIGGYLLVRKTRRLEMVCMFLITFLIIASVFSFIRNPSPANYVHTLYAVFTRTAVLFFASVMLIEPLTSPTTKKMQLWYAGIVGVLYATPQMRLFSFILTPELALLWGNIFSYFVSPNFRLSLRLLSNIAFTSDTHLFTFRPVDHFIFTPGQYMEWTLPHKRPDSRGNRRYFSLSSSPTETTPMVLVKFYSPSSSYKTKLFALLTDQEIIAASLAGDFVMPKDKTRKLVFIAGGVGVAPFRSMIKYLIDTKEVRDIILIFINKQKEDIIFQNLLTLAQTIGVKTHYVLTNKETIPQDWTGEVGHLDTTLIQKLVPDFTKRIFYVSGPQLMVQTIERTLKQTGIKGNHIKTDFFPGYTER